MAAVKKLKSALLSAKIPNEIMSQFDFDGKEENESYTLLDFIQQVDKLVVCNP